MSRTDSPEEPDDLLLFTPIVTAYRGANGWSSEVQRAFVAALARCGTVAAAARSVGRSPSSTYQLRRRAGENSSFARAWDEAQSRAADEALDRSMAGGMVARRTEVFHRGRHVGWRTQYDNRLAYAALRALDKREARWAAGGLDATMLVIIYMTKHHDVAKPDADRPAFEIPQEMVDRAYEVLERGSWGPPDTAIDLADLRELLPQALKAALYPYQSKASKYRHQV